MKKLDFLYISYNQDIRVRYFDTQLQRERVAVPDFYLPDQNKLVEIKSPWTYDKQNMLDKETAYKALGYNFELRLDEDIKEPRFI